ncbi:hypothetical protein [Nocardia sp. NPDC047038]|uniref:hypothetical protein n=1 Tax=Nocardia sp. NPDC047038 TaxID=3154338 RepID=UPI0033E346F4
MVERIPDIADAALRRRAAAMVTDHLDRAQTVFEQFTATAQVEALIHRLRDAVTGIDIDIQLRPRDLSVYTDFTITGPGAGTLMALVTDWLDSTGQHRDRIPAGVDIDFDQPSFTLSVGLQQPAAEAFFTWYRYRSDPAVLDANSLTAIRDVSTRYQRTAHPDPRLETPLTVLARAHAIATAPAWCALPEHLRASMSDGYDSDAVNNILGQITDATGVRVVCVWDVYDDFGYTGSSDFRVEDPLGHFYYLSGDLWAWLNETADHAPAHPGSPASWIGGIDTEHTTHTLAGGDGAHNHAIHDKTAPSGEMPAHTDPLERELDHAHAQARFAADRVTTLSLTRIRTYLREHAPTVDSVEFILDTDGLVPTTFRDTSGTPIDAATPGHDNWISDISQWSIAVTDPDNAGLTRSEHAPFVLDLAAANTTDR